MNANNTQHTRAKGQVGEDAACQFLTRTGYTIIERNWQRPLGEVDIVAEKSGILRFVEVKSTFCTTWPIDGADDYRPEELVHEKKLRKIGRLAEWYVMNRKDKRDFQIDVVAVFLNAKTHTARCRLIENVY